MKSSKSTASSMSCAKKYRIEMMYSVLCLALGMLSGYVSSAGCESLWYQSLNQPSFSPPSWIFGPVWTVLYIMMGTALGKLCKARKRDNYLITIFAIQFALNLLWSPLFFYYHCIDLALIDICMLWLSLLYFMMAARKHHTVFLLFLPYMLWISFATVISYHVYRMNLVC